MTRTRVALHEFMPYGAPDLIAGRSEAQSGALAGAVGLWGVVFVSLLLAVRMMPPPAPTPIVAVSEFTITAVPSMHPHALNPVIVEPAKARFRDEGVLVPVAAPGHPAPEWSPALEPGSGVAITTDAAPATGSSDGVAGTTPDDRPDIDVWVVHDVEPEIVAPVVPEYPSIAHEAGIEGTVHVQALVGRDGTVHEILVRDGPIMLREAAADAARATRFRPAESNGHAVAVWVMMPFHFSLH